MRYYFSFCLDRILDLNVVCRVTGILKHLHSLKNGLDHFITQLGRLREPGGEVLLRLLEAFAVGVEVTETYRVTPALLFRCD